MSMLDGSNVFITTFLCSFLSKYYIQPHASASNGNTEDTLQIVGINIKFFEWNQKWSSFAECVLAK